MTTPTQSWRPNCWTHVDSGSGETFPFIAERRIRRYYSRPRYSDWSQSREIFIADIWELLPTGDQADALRALKADCPDRLAWASASMIERRGVGLNEGTVQVGEQTLWIL